MAKGKESFERRQRERAKKAKADQKRERRQSREPSSERADDGAATPPDPVDQDAVLAELAQLHADFDDERVGFEEFEERRTELLARLRVD